MDISHHWVPRAILARGPHRCSGADGRGAGVPVVPWASHLPCQGSFLCLHIRGKDRSPAQRGSGQTTGRKLFADCEVLGRHVSGKFSRGLSRAAWPPGGAPCRRKGPEGGLPGTSDQTLQMKRTRTPRDADVSPQVHRCILCVSMCFPLI